MGYFRWLYNNFKGVLKLFRDYELVLALIISLLMVFNLICGVASAIFFFTEQILLGSIFAMTTVILFFVWSYLLYILGLKR